MNVLIVQFELAGIRPEEYRAHCAQVAPVFATIPGLVAKYWIADEAANTYGGVYIFRDPEALEAYRQSDLFKQIQANPAFAAASQHAFEVLADATAITRGFALTAASVGH